MQERALRSIGPAEEKQGGRLEWLESGVEIALLAPFVLVGCKPIYYNKCRIGVGKEQTLSGFM